MAARLRLAIAAGLALVTLACTIPISYYDATTYKTLTDLKVDATQLVASFDSRPVADNETEITATRTRLQKAYEYEKGKGKDNNDTATQMRLLIELYDRAVVDYRVRGPNPAVHDFRELAEQLSQAFDTAISTESAKNHDKS